MCGIAGIYSFEKFKDEQKIKKLVVSLLKDIEIRGRDASGISLINSQEDEITTYKTDLSASNFVNKKNFHKLFYNVTDYNIILLHTRYKTRGDADINVNNHPHYDKKHNNVLIHNGVISNYLELKERYKDKIKLSGDCDSEIILSLFNHKRQNLKETLKHLSGSLAIGLFNKNKLYLYAHNNPLNLCYNKTRDLYLFSSHEDIFKELFEEEEDEEKDGLFKFYKNKEEYSVYSLYEDDFIKIKFKNHKIEKTDADIYEEKYKPFKSNIKVITEKEETQQFLEDEIKKEEEKEEEIKKQFYNEKDAFDYATQYATDKEYDKIVYEEYKKYGYNNFEEYEDDYNKSYNALYK